MKNIKIEEVSDLNMTYNYLEIFVNHNPQPFLEVSINENKELVFTYLTTKETVKKDELDYIHTFANDFLSKQLKNEADYLKFMAANE
ncbi:hypothetical protein [Flavobacterium sp. HNIBRBA15423]|uniref:hypothetical protein n=1 Tax=Flavobacterium sp. HNIBRBA15423 TaxID=3458683 RepID=UPI004043DBAC